VVEYEDVGIAHRFHRLRIVTNRRRVLADLDLRKDNADVHRFGSLAAIIAQP
jgi:hypothetical protein